MPKETLSSSSAIPNDCCSRAPRSPDATPTSRRAGRSSLPSRPRRPPSPRWWSRSRRCKRPPARWPPPSCSTSPPSWPRCAAPRRAAAVARRGRLAPLPAAEPVESPLSPTELLSLVNALTVSGKARPRIVADAVERGAIRDLRLLPFCVRALGDPAVGYVVQDKLFPRSASSSSRSCAPRCTSRTARSSTPRSSACSRRS